MKTFDLIFENKLNPAEHPPLTLGRMLFEDLPGRSIHSRIILSHIGTGFTEVNLLQIRGVVAGLLKCFSRTGISRGETIALITFPGCNEMYTALLFLALATKGCRVLLPMFSETAEFTHWMKVAEVKQIIVPEGEVMSLDGHDKEKESVAAIRRIALAQDIRMLDIMKDFGFPEAITTSSESAFMPDDELQKSLMEVSPTDEVLIMTTSGTTGRSKLVVYTHEAFWLNCRAWHQAGFYEDALLGGTGFTPMFTHTMGIRAFVNALYTGSPVCLIITEWFTLKPETVRYLLLKMKPSHITGGPAVYNAFLELYRLYPELKSTLSPHLKTLVSSGAGYNSSTAHEVFDALGLQLHNAFGTTETQQVLSTLLSSSEVFGHGMLPLGSLLPGVSVGLEKMDSENGCYRMYLHSFFGHSRCIGEDETPDFFDTGDLVALTNNGELLFAGRCCQDYFKDSFGVKVPIRILKSYYESLMRQILHIEFFPVINFPGLSALLFIREPDICHGPVSDTTVLKRYACIVEGINNLLKTNIEPFEFNHRHICRIALINQPPPTTRKGTISVKEIQQTYADLIGRLQDCRKESHGIEITESQSQSTDQYTRYMSPQIGSMLSALKMNQVYHRGLKDTLFTYLDGKESAILDLTGGYGANLLGHANPLITEAVTDFMARGGVAVNNQLSIPHHTGMLAARLSLMVGAATGRSFRVVFVNSGSEALEVALHHALMEWKHRFRKLRDCQMQKFGSNPDIDMTGIWKRNEEIISQAAVYVIALSHAFHGQTTGARSLLGNTKKRVPFSNLSKVEAIFVDDLNPEWHEHIRQIVGKCVIPLEKVVQTNGKLTVETFHASTIIAAITEPVIGEGGVRKVDPAVPESLSGYDFPLISDEIQCGLGRTGELPAFLKAGYYLFGKSLGGGVEKIAAVLIDSRRYQFDFCEYYVSTCGNGELAAVAALKTLDIIENENIPALAFKIGEYLMTAIETLSRRFPAVLKDVKGEGLMLGVTFNKNCGRENVMLRGLFDTEKAGYLFAAWFFHRHRIRIFPTLSAPETLRIEPSAYLTEGEANHFLKALEELCRILEEKRLYDLLSFLMDHDLFDDNKGLLPVFGHYRTHLEEPLPGAEKVAFIAHFVNPVNELRMLEPDLCRASDTGLRILFNRLQLLMEMKPFKLIANNIFKGRIHFSFYVLPIDSAGLEYLHKCGKSRRVTAKIQEAVNLAAREGAKVVSLGGYTSILSCNGLSMAEPQGCRIITGNTLTAASGLANLKQYLAVSPEFSKPSRIAIVGATGNIGLAIASMLIRQPGVCSSMVLVARSAKRLEVTGQALAQQKDPAITLETTTDLLQLKTADILIMCANTNDPLVYPHHISSEKRVIISDLSVPSALAKETAAMANVISMPFASYVCMPDDPEAVISSLSPAGTVFCCAAEAMVAGLEPCPFPLKGHIDPESLQQITKLADKHGFFDHLGQIKSYKSTI